MAKGFGLGAALLAAGVVVGSVGLPAAPVKPHLTTYVAMVGVSATMWGDASVESSNSFVFAAVVLIIAYFALLLMGMSVAVRTTTKPRGAAGHFDALRRWWGLNPQRTA
jgi:hypothetical protein